MALLLMVGLISHTVCCEAVSVAVLNPLLFAGIHLRAAWSMVDVICTALP